MSNKSNKNYIAVLTAKNNKTVREEVVAANIDEARSMVEIVANMKGWSFDYLYEVESF